MENNDILNYIGIMGLRGSMNISRYQKLIIDFIDTPSIETIKSSELYKEGDIQSDLVNNWEVGLASTNNNEVAKKLILDQLLNNLRQLCNTTQSQNNVIEELKNRLISPSCTILSTLENLQTSVGLNKELYAAIDDENKMKEIEAKAVRVIEPFIKSMSDYMDVNEYLYRVAKGLEAIKQVEFNIEIEKVIELYRSRLSLVKKLIEEKISIDIKDTELKCMEDLPDPKSNLIVGLMFEPEVTKEQLESTTIFKSVRSIVENLFILKDRFKNELDKLHNCKLEELNIDYLAVDIIKNALSDKINTKELSDEEIKEFMTILSNNSNIIKAIDVDFYVNIYTEIHKINALVSGVALIYVIMENIMKQ